MNFQVANQGLLKGVQTTFNRTYPFLKIEFSKKGGLDADPEVGSEEETVILVMAQKLLWDEFGLSDDMKVSELEVLLQYQFSLPVKILRKSGHLWMEIRSSRDWTLRQQNTHGEDISSGFDLI